jgi:hypothetical protein
MLTAHRPRVCVCACVCAWLAASRESGIGFTGGTELITIHHVHLLLQAGTGGTGVASAAYRMGRGGRAGESWERKESLAVLTAASKRERCVCVCVLTCSRLAD